jgi:hypothetical protein
MTSVRSIVLKGLATAVMGACLLAPVRAAAQTTDAEGAVRPVTFTPNFAGLTFDLPAAPQAPAPVAFEYSDGYHTRDRIHHVASFAMLPLFAAQVYVGQKMFNDPASATSTLRQVHGSLAIAITGLFAVNSVTGVWNLVEARKDPHGSMRRTIHGVLMLVADAGFVATAIDHPNGRSANGVAIYTAKENQHLALAYASFGVATVGYLLMLFR